MWLCSKSTGNESRLVTWRSHWECRAQTGPWWPTLKGWGGHVQKGSRGTWRAASRRAQFAADRRHCKRHSDILEELKLQYARGTEGHRVIPRCFLTCTNGQSDARSCHTHFLSSCPYMWPHPQPHYWNFWECLYSFYPKLWSGSMGPLSAALGRLNFCAWERLWVTLLWSIVYIIKFFFLVPYCFTFFFPLLFSIPLSLFPFFFLISFFLFFHFLSLLLLFKSQELTWWSGG